MDSRVVEVGVVEDEAIDLSESNLVALGLFDAEFYVRTYPDVAKSGLTPFEHFVCHGLAEGRLPSTCFSPEDYFEMNPDVAASGLTALEHFVVYGRREGRFGTRAEHEIACSGLFDPQFYLELYPDIAASGVPPLSHYIDVGWSEQRRPCAEFNLEAFWAAFPNLSPGSVNPVLYYIRVRDSSVPQPSL